jgi:ketosteroid isomerase-like protein
MQMTEGQTFYYRLSSALEAQDLATLQTLYHPDATLISLSTGQVERGREAILSSFQHTFQIAGAISSRSVESLVETEGSICVEATLATQFGPIQTYDIYLRHSDMVKQHVSGLISPRPPGGQRQGQGFPQTKDAALYHRWCQALETQDLAALSTLYHPDVVFVAYSIDQSSRGREAIINSFKQAIQIGVDVKLKSVECFVESSEIICAEVTRTISLPHLMGAMRYDGPSRMGLVQCDMLMYDVLVLRAGRIGQSFSGLISPRGSELQQYVKPRTWGCYLDPKPRHWRRW